MTQKISAHPTDSEILDILQAPTKISELLHQLTNLGYKLITSAYIFDRFRSLQSQKKLVLLRISGGVYSVHTEPKSTSFGIRAELAKKYIGLHASTTKHKLSGFEKAIEAGDTVTLRSLLQHTKELKSLAKIPENSIAFSSAEAKSKADEIQRLLEEYSVILEIKGSEVEESKIEAENVPKTAQDVSDLPV